MIERNDTEITNLNYEQSYCEGRNLSVLTVQETEIIYNEPISENDNLKFDWDEGKIGLLTAAYYFGYVPSIMPGTIIGEKIGFFNYVGTVLFATSILTLSFPVITTTFGFWGAMISRILMGKVKNISCIQTNPKFVTNFIEKTLSKI